MSDPPVGTLRFFPAERGDQLRAQIVDGDLFDGLTQELVGRINRDGSSGNASVQRNLTSISTCFMEAICFANISKLLVHEIALSHKLCAQSRSAAWNY